jgi:YggT family protein
MMNALLRGLSFLVDVALNFWIWILLLRLVLQKSGASYYNPFSQLLLRLTEWLIRPTRKYLKLGHWRRYDWGLIFWLVVFSCIGVWGLTQLTGVIQDAPFVGFMRELQLRPLALWQEFLLVLLQGLGFLLKQLIYLFFFAILIRALISWFPQAMSSPLFPLLCRMTDPVLNIFKRVIPPIGGIDFSPLFALILLQLVNRMVFWG